MKLLFTHFLLNRFALVEHWNCIDAQRNLSAFLRSALLDTVFSGVQAGYARPKKTTSKFISSTHAGIFQ
jgi:hypothetical protein